MTHKNAPNLLKELNLTEREFSMLVRQDSEIRSLLFKRAELERSISAISDDISKVEAAERLSKSKEPEKIQSLLMKWKEACKLALVEVRDLLGPRLQEPYQDDWNKRRKVDIDEESDEEADEEEEEEEEECKGWAAFLAKVSGFEQAGKVRTSVEKEEHIAQELIEGAVGISVDAGHRAEGGLWNLKELGLKLGIDVLALGYYDIDADCFD
ncbi:hypothetical protein BC830DRAFT_1143756 [Chytriomyces sp. MP71]|nr:hypothetical protein BC830DRAFT_1143756 [Chytriomyces sp. MP71]